MPSIFTLNNQELHVRVEEDAPQRVSVASGEVTIDGKGLSSEVVTGPFTLLGTGRVVIEDASPQPKKKSAPKKSAAKKPAAKKSSSKAKKK